MLFQTRPQPRWKRNMKTDNPTEMYIWRRGKAYWKEVAAR